MDYVRSLINKKVVQTVLDIKTIESLFTRRDEEIKEREKRLVKSLEYYKIYKGETLVTQSKYLGR